MRTRPARRRDDAAVDEVVGRAFGEEEGPTIAALLALLAASGHRVAALVAERDGSIVGHVQLSRSWVDARERLVEVLVLASPARRSASRTPRARSRCCPRTSRG